MNAMPRYPRLMRAIAAQLPELSHAAEIRLRLTGSGLEVELRSDDGHAHRVVFTELFEEIFNDAVGFAVARDLMALDELLEETDSNPAEA
jgi:hypothetical protein